MIKIILIITLIILIIIELYKEHFNYYDRFDKCSKYDSESYSKCYNSNECSVMIDLLGNAFCTSKNI